MTRKNTKIRVTETSSDGTYKHEYIVTDDDVCLGPAESLSFMVELLDPFQDRDEYELRHAL